MPTLPVIASEHRERIDPHVEQLPRLADMIGKTLPETLMARFDEEYAFIVGTLVPHMQTIEASLYPRLEQLMQNRHSMAPMRREHQELATAVSSLDGYRKLVDGCALGKAEGMGLRRVLYRLYAILKVHLAEEDAYLALLERNLSAEELDTLALGIEHAIAQPL